MPIQEKLPRTEKIEFIKKTLPFVTKMRKEGNYDYTRFSLFGWNPDKQGTPQELDIIATWGTEEIVRGTKKNPLIINEFNHYYPIKACRKGKPLINGDVQKGGWPPEQKDKAIKLKIGSGIAIPIIWDEPQPLGALVFFFSDTFKNGSPTARQREFACQFIVRGLVSTAEVIRTQDFLQTVMKSVRHDLRNVLSGADIAGKNVLFSPTDATRDEAIDAIKGMCASLNRANTILYNMTTDDLIFQDRVVLNKEKVNLHEFLQGIIDDITPTMKGKASISLLSVTPPVFVRIDRVLFDRVVENILVNASVHAPPGNVDVTVVSRAGKVAISFRDYGPGVPDDEKEFIFEKGYRIGGRPAGSGLGLFICRQIVEYHNGHITAENPADKKDGAVFKIILPLAKEA